MDIQAKINCPGCGRLMKQRIHYNFKCKNIDCVILNVQFDWRYIMKNKENDL